MFEYFYHNIFRKTIIGFGNLFNNITIKRVNDNGVVFSKIKVPLAYGPTQKFLARLEQSPDLNKPIQITLPRMSFEFTGLNYDGSRKVTTTQTFLASDVSDGTKIKKVYMPVPYNMDFELSIFTKQNDDMLQIIEQILPYFQPAYTITVDLLEEIGEKRDIPLVLNNISMQDDYEGDFTTRRSLIYTLKFTAKTYLFGPLSKSDTSKDIIKKVSIGYVAGDSTTNPIRDLVYSVEPVATKNYTNNVVSTLISDVVTSSTTITVDADTAINVPISSYITLNNETLFVRSKDGNLITVDRGSYGTQIEDHVIGTEVKLITQSDNSLIEFGDNFGFNGEFA
jgi:hypothetical protein